jgi:hypothetical protein
MPRPAAPWFRSSANAWYATVNGRKVSLGVRGEENRKQAVTAWHRLMGGLPLETPQTLQQTPEPPQAAPQPTPPPKQEPGQSLPALVAAFLADAELRVKPESHRGYAKFLNPFAADFKDTPPDRLTAAQVERWSKKPGWSQSYVRLGEYVASAPGQALVLMGCLRPIHVRVNVDEEDIPRLRLNVPARAKLRGDPTQEEIPMTFVRLEPYVVPKVSLTGVNTERVDTRVVQVIYAIDPENPQVKARRVLVGQLLDVFIDTRAASPASVPSP